MAKMEEYYKLDAEDFIDDMPCRFKYKQVAPSMYGLSTKEMLAMSDRQLTQIMPLKKLAPYRHDSDMQTDVKVKARAQRMAREFIAEDAKRAKERKKNKGKKKKKGGDDDATATATARTRTPPRRPPRRSARLPTPPRLGVSTTWTTNRGGSARLTLRRTLTPATGTTPPPPPPLRLRRRWRPRRTTPRPRGRVRTPRKTPRSA